jgi:hypothetical protein
MLAGLARTSRQRVILAELSTIDCQHRELR